ncbi:MAG: hypothetical protein R3F41_03685 [Gammaproteobacteria bacterium]|nr:hypothetical protein [Pseudomonadales bacterium]MCP5345606.1 hypothetical protein [Pseudomonadales bacterium]
MIFRLLALLVLLFLIYWGMNSLSRRFSLTRNQANGLLVLAISLTVIVVLIVMGRIPVQFILAPLGVAATFLLRALPAVVRLMPFWQMLRSKYPFHRRRSGNSASSKSVIRTEYLAMELLHGSGELDGQVLKGRFSGQRLSSLDRRALMQLAGECGSDPDSVQVLEAYLDRMHSGWRDEIHQHREREEYQEEPAMNRQLALEILGLNESASREDVNLAHRKLMQKMHPDRGGTEYLAKKINAARDYLLEHL